ncbi:MAG: C-GCAxxG-C-C family protein [Promethearchaeota archaeon]
MKEKDINLLFDDKIKKLAEDLPKIKNDRNCAALTLTNILEILGLDNFYFYNLAIPLAGGFGGFKSLKGWKGPCGAVCGGCAAIGVILGGQKKLESDQQLNVYQTAAKFVHYFEKEFGSTSCQELCGVVFSDLNSINEYEEKKLWEKQCYKYVIFAIDKIRELTASDLKNKWE